MEFYYYIPGSSTVWTSRPKEDWVMYESFGVTRPELKKGFLVYFSYTNYDSMGPSSTGTDYDIIDLYETYEEAAKMAKLMREYEEAQHSYNRGGRNPVDIEKEFFYAGPTDRRPYVGMGWGTNVENIYVEEVEVLDVTEAMKRQKVF